MPTFPRFALVAVLLCLSLPVTAASLQCPRYSAVLEGTTTNPGGSYTERVAVSKIGAGSGYSGRWKIDYFESIITYGRPLGLNFARVDRHNLGNGIFMEVACSVIGNRIHCRTTKHNMVLEVAGNKIRMENTAPWNGSISGNTMTWKFHPENSLEPLLRGTNRRSQQRAVTLSIIEPTASQKYVFSANPVGALEMKLKAKVTPERYANNIVWNIPKIDGKGRRASNAELRGAEITVTYDGLPRSNDDFGKKQVSATLNVGACRAEESREVRFFYPREAKNNPGGKAPNWFYYWKQTPAAKPEGASISILYGARSFESCGDNITGAIFSPKSKLYRTVHVCDLAKFGPQFSIVYPILQHQNPGKKFLGYQTSTGIDTFAAALVHENVHLKIFNQWKIGKSLAQLEARDADRDGLQDTAEPGLGFDPEKLRTHLPHFTEVENDEEWLAYETQSGYKKGTYDAYDWSRPGKNWPLNQP